MSTKTIEENTENQVIEEKFVDFDKLRNVLIEKTQVVKPGCWIIREWDYGFSYAGSVDFVKFKQDINGVEFKYDCFYRFYNSLYDRSVGPEKTEMITNVIDKDRCTYVDYHRRLVFNFRPASKLEISIHERKIHNRDMVGLFVE